MGRVINTDNPGKVRNQLMRSCAELMRHLSQKQAIDDESKDMAACLVMCLREIERGIDDSAAVWEKRDYWIKAEQLRQRWDWVAFAADQLENILRKEAWEKMPDFMVKLFPRFADVKVTRITRSSELWEGAYAQFLKPQP